MACQLAIGHPGTGKTSTMRVAVEAWRQAGSRVIGAAVKGEAARLLGHAAEIESNTLAWYLAHDDLDRHPFYARTVVVVDEASTISDRDLDRLLELGRLTGCAIRLVGDPVTDSGPPTGTPSRASPGCSAHLPGLSG